MLSDVSVGCPGLLRTTDSTVKPVHPLIRASDLTSEIDIRVFSDAFLRAYKRPSKSPSVFQSSSFKLEQCHPQSTTPNFSASNLPQVQPFLQLSGPHYAFGFLCCSFDTVRLLLLCWLYSAKVSSFQSPCSYLSFRSDLSRQVRLAAFVIRAILVSSTSAGENLSLFIADEVFFYAGYFGLLYGSFSLTRDRWVTFGRKLAIFIYWRTLPVSLYATLNHSTTSCSTSFAVTSFSISHYPLVSS